MKKEHNVPKNKKYYNSMKWWTPYNIKVGENYQFIRKDIFFRFFNPLIREIVLIILPIYNYLVFGLEVQGKENLKAVKNTSSITICNHINTLDCTMVGCALGHKKGYFPVQKSNLEIPFIRLLVRVLGGIPIPKTIKGLEAFEDAIEEILKDNENYIQIYPEGKLVPYYEGIREFKNGAFKFAVKYDKPILPLVITYKEATGIRKLIKRKPLLVLNVLEVAYPDKSLDKKEAVIKLKEQCYNNMIKKYQESDYDIEYIDEIEKFLN